MKKFYLSVITVFIFSSFYSQEAFEYYNGYLQGFRKACNCSNTPPNANNISSKLGYWQDGYNAGYTDGRIFLYNNQQNINSKNNSDSYSNTVYDTPDYNLMYNALAQKQALLDKRRNTIQLEYDKISDITYNAAQNRSSKSLTQVEKDYFIQKKRLLDQYVNYDLTINITFNQIMNWLYEWEVEVSRW